MGFFDFELYALRLRVNAMPYALCGMLVIGFRPIERWWGRRFQYSKKNWKKFRRLIFMITEIVRRVGVEASAIAMVIRRNNS
jgi:hypothetical protein